MPPGVALYTEVIMSNFETPEIVTREVTIGGNTATYQFRELSELESEKMFDIMRDGKVDASKSKGLRRRIIAACVKREDGTAISEKEAGEMRTKLAVELQRIALDVNGFGGKDEDEEGN
jgi:hypothetical protein